MKKDVRYFLYTLIMDGINEGTKHQDTNTNVVNYKSILANKVMKKHGLDMNFKWMLENPEYLDDWDNDLYSMSQIAFELISKGKKYVDEAPETMTKEYLKQLMTSYQFDINSALQKRNKDEKKQG